MASEVKNTISWVFGVRLNVRRPVPVKDPDARPVYEDVNIMVNGRVYPEPWNYEMAQACVIAVLDQTFQAGYTIEHMEIKH